VLGALDDDGIHDEIVHHLLVEAEPLRQHGVIRCWPCARIRDDVGLGAPVALDGDLLPVTVATTFGGRRRR